MINRHLPVRIMLGTRYSRFISRELQNFLDLYKRRIFISSADERQIVNQFHKLYYNAALFNKTWKSTRWFGVPTQKCPLDLWIYQEILYKVRPDIIIETGTAAGGSTLFLAYMCNLLNKGKIISIDIKPNTKRPRHKRITYKLGSSTAEDIFRQVKSKIKEKDKVLVILDSDHSKNHVLKELKLYAPLVSKNSYLIVEDTNLNGHPVNKNHGPGPKEALEEFLKNRTDFQIDREKESHYMTFSPGGFLKRIKVAGS